MIKILNICEKKFEIKIVVEIGDHGEIYIILFLKSF